MFSAHRSHLLLWIVFVIILYCASFHTIVDARGGKGKGKKSKGGDVRGETKKSESSKKATHHGKGSHHHSKSLSFLRQGQEHWKAERTQIVKKHDFPTGSFFLQVTLPGDDQTIRYCPTTVHKPKGKKAEKSFAMITVLGDVHLTILECSDEKLNKMPRVFVTQSSGSIYIVSIDKKAYKKSPLSADQVEELKTQAPAADKHHSLLPFGNK